MADAAADVAEPPAEQAPEKDMTMTAHVGGDLAAVLLGSSVAFSTDRAQPGAGSHILSPFELRRAGFTPTGTAHFRGPGDAEVRE
jgi:hypothetical protein